MAVSMSLINKLQTRHLKFEINWAHGGFMDEIPRRLSQSQALAAATEAFLLAVPCADVSHTLSRRRLRSYTLALQTTRLALSHPSEAYSLNTLCAVYLLWICQVCPYASNINNYQRTRINVLQSWMDIPEDTSIHPRGLALLLNQPIRFDARDSFDRGVVYVACTVVVCEAAIRLLHQTDPR